MKRWKQIEFSLYLNSPFLISKTHQKEILKRKLSEFIKLHRRFFFLFISKFSRDENGKPRKKKY